MTVIGTWNVENLFKFRPGSTFGPTSQAAYDAKLKGLAATTPPPTTPWSSPD